jgi:hypothetical protein
VDAAMPRELMQPGDDIGEDLDAGVVGVEAGAL